MARSAALRRIKQDVPNPLRLVKTVSTPGVSSLTGRPRKLSDGVMLDICQQFAEGAKVTDLEEAYGISAHTIYSIVYWTPRKKHVD